MTLADGVTGSGVLQISLVSPEQILLQAEASAVTVPAYDGLVGILPRHAPMLALLGRGILTVHAGATERRFRVGGGFVQMRANTVRIVAEEAAALEV